jgi:hypothetical protein
VANRKTHVSAGIASGAAAAFYMARQQQGGAFVGELFGGSLGGFVGALLPDKLEPPLQVRRRIFAAYSGADGPGLAQAAERAGSNLVILTAAYFSDC